ncbi:hypothetical protein, partial [Thiolapillus sp.]
DACLLACWPRCLPAGLLASMPACWPAGLDACLLACWPRCLPAGLLASMPGIDAVIFSFFCAVPLCLCLGFPLENNLECPSLIFPLICKNPDPADHRIDLDISVLLCGFRIIHLMDFRNYS